MDGLHRLSCSEKTVRPLLRLPQHLRLRPRADTTCLHRSISSGLAGLRAGEGDRIGRLHPIRAQVRRRADHLFTAGTGSSAVDFHSRIAAGVFRTMPQGRWRYRSLFDIVWLFFPRFFLLGGPVNLNRHFASVPMSGRLLSWRWLGRRGWNLDRRGGTDSCGTCSLAFVENETGVSGRPERRGPLDWKGMRPRVVPRASFPLPAFPPLAAHRLPRVRFPTEQSDWAPWCRL